MFQSFTETASPDQGPPRLAALRAVMRAEGLDGFIIPRADAHQGEYVAERDSRLAWLTGFTGSAGYCVALRDRAGVFVDGRYRVQVRSQAEDVFTPVDWPEMSLGQWITDSLSTGSVVGFDPWLHTVSQIRELETAVGDIALRRSANLVDRIWEDQPPPPATPAFAQPVDLAGESHDAKIDRLAGQITSAATAVLTLPDSICWLLNIRGDDVPRTPFVQGFALLHASGEVTFFVDPAKLDGLGDHLGPKVRVLPVGAFLPALTALEGPVQIDPHSCPMIVADALRDAGIEIIEAQDPCALPKACKTRAELDGALPVLARSATHRQPDRDRRGPAARSGTRGHQCAARHQLRHDFRCRAERGHRPLPCDRTDQPERRCRPASDRQRRAICRWHHRHHPHHPRRIG